MCLPQQKLAKTPTGEPRGIFKAFPTLLFSDMSSMRSGNDCRKRFTQNRHTRIEDLNELSSCGVIL